jgi:putative ABC transport system ATP-binding protein
MEVIQLQDVARVYRIGEVETHALRGVTLDISDGEFTAIVGPSGSGKTTMLQLMGCLDRPSTGTVHINGRDVTRLKPNARADLRKGTIGFIFQFFALIPGLTAYENIERHRPDQMSGGEQQRVAIARALATRPVLVLADEPTANLDTENGRQVMEIMQRLNVETGTTYVFATHDPRVIPFARRVVTLRDGQISDNDLHD